MFIIKKITTNKKGFTLIEILVVVSIIGLLASVVFASLNTARGNARNATRRSDLIQIRTALELYYNDNGSYPKSYGSTWTGVNTYNYCSGGNGSCTYSGSTGYIPDLAPAYIPVLPKDPSSSINGYLYKSDGTDYMMLIYATVENCSSPPGTAGTVMTRAAPGHSTECDYAIFTPAAKYW